MARSCSLFNKYDLYDLLLSGNSSWTEEVTLEEMLIQCHFDGLSWFPKVTRDLEYNTIALAGEVGEFANKFKKVLRGDKDYDYSNPEVREDLALELTDVLVYLLNCFAIMNVNPEATYAIVRARNIERFGQPDHDAALRSLNGQGSSDGPS